MISVSDSNTKLINAELTILKTIAYFDIFEYPLDSTEIKNFLSDPVDEKEFRAAIQSLLSVGIVFKHREFYSLSNNDAKIKTRLEGNKRASKLLSRANNIGAFLHKFPYVRSVLVSGSLSKGYADEKSDIDFFIITKTNRLWIARTILHLFKKLTFLTATQNLYCMNYFIDEECLEIPEKNIYTATEIVTLFPVSGSPSSDQFFTKNAWVKGWLPQYKYHHKAKVSDTDSFLKKVLEQMLNNKIGDRLDDFLFWWTSRRWRKKEQHGRKNSKGKVMNLVTGKHFSKSNPEAFQEKIVAMYEARIRELDEHRHRLKRTQFS